ncbi:hypothetical protein H4S00_005061, partial [Coemansia sp. D1744]
MTSCRSARVLAKAASPVLAPKASNVVKRPVPKKPVVRVAAVVLSTKTPAIDAGVTHATLADPGTMEAAILYLKNA